MYGGMRRSPFLLGGNFLSKHKQNIYSCSPSSNLNPTIVHSSSTLNMGDLNNVSAMRPVVHFDPDFEHAYRSFAITEQEDDAAIRSKYRPFLVHPTIALDDWVSKLELSTVSRLVEENMRQTKNDRLKVLVLYGSLRSRFVGAEFQTGSPQAKFLHYQVIFSTPCF